MKVLVTSYDNDEQQWFHDLVEAPTADAAEEYICRLRPTVIAADAIPADVAAQWTALPTEYDTTDPLTECQDCETVTPESVLDTIRDLSQRVDAGEPMPAGECPFCGALCHRIEAI